MTKRNITHNQTQKVVRELLGAMTEGREVRAWLKQFGRLERSRFAIIKIGGGTLRDELTTICSSLAFLQKLGLSPIIVHGGGPQIDAALGLARIETGRRDGLRITDDRAMPVVSSALRAASLDFISALNSHGVQAEFCPASMVQAELVDEDNLGRVGVPAKIDLAAISQIAQRGDIPILSSVAIASDGKEANINADALVRELAIGLRPQKIVFLTPTGAILDQEQRRISVIHLTSEYDYLMAQDWLQGGMKLKLQQISEILSELPLTASVAITSPGALVKELFTHSGSGTLIRKGEKIEVKRDKLALNREKTCALIEKSFGRKLTESYWNDLGFEFAITSNSHRAIALVTQLNGIPYLDKFAVLEEARGEGLGAAVWRQLLDQTPKLFWRSRIGNPVNSFYFAEADGSARINNWQVFWIGEVNWDSISDNLSRIAALPDAFEGEA